MSNLDSDFRPDLMTFDDCDYLQTRKLFIYKLCSLLPQYIDNEMKIQNITSENKEPFYKQCQFTKKLLALPNDKFENAINPPDGVNCFCEDKTKKT